MKRKKIMILLLAAMMIASTAVPAAAAPKSAASAGTDVATGDEKVIQAANDISQIMYKLGQGEFDTIRLTGDAVIKTQKVNLGSAYLPNVTIDLNGHNLSIENDVIVGAGGTLTIKGEGNLTGTDNITVSGGTFNDNHTESSTISPSDPGEEPVEDTAVAAIGDKTFDSLQDAVDASTGAEKIVILKPVDITETGLDIPKSKRITIDLAKVNGNPNIVNKKTYAILAGTGDKGITIEGALSITDSDGVNSYIATTDDSEDALFTVTGSGMLFLSRGYIEAIGPGKGNLGSHAIIAKDKANIKINAENRDAAMVKAKKQSTVLLSDEAVLEMKGGSLRNQNTYVVEDHSSKTIRFSQDTYLRSGEAGFSNGLQVITTDTGKVMIAGGIYRTDTLIGCLEATGNGSISVAGGYFKQAVPEEMLVNGYTQEQEWIVEDNWTGSEVRFWAVKKAGAVSPTAEPSSAPTTAPTTIPTGTPTKTPTSVPVSDRFGTVYSTNLSLKGKVGLNVYLNLPERILKDEGATIEITRNGKKETFKVADLETFEVKKQTLVSVTTYVTAKEMSDDIAIRVITGEGGSLPLKDAAGNKSKNGAYTTSVAALLNSLKANKQVPKNLQALYTALGTYGEYAQLYFKHNSEGVEPADTLADVSDSTLSAFKAKKSGNLSGVSFVGGNLILDSDTTLMMYFTSKKDLSGYTFAIDGKKAEVEKDGNYYIVTLNGIEARNLNKAYAFSVSDGKNTLTVNYSALTYAATTLSGTNQDLIKLMKAMYKYNVAADAYFNA